MTTSTGGGVNATVTALVMIGPLLLVLYEVGIGEISVRAAVSFGWRTILATGAARCGGWPRCSCSPSTA